MCQGCGHPVGESTDPALEEAWQAEIVRCHACSAASRKADGWHEAGGDSHGINVRVSRKGLR